MERENRPAAVRDDSWSPAASGAPARFGAQPDLLVLAPCLPAPVDRGDRARWYHMLRLLARDYRVHLGCFADPERDRSHLGRIKALCYETCFVAPPRTGRVRALRAIARGEPPLLPRYRSEVLGAWSARLLERQPVRAALACSARMAEYLLDSPHCTRLLDLVTVESERRRHAAAGRHWPLGAIAQREAALQLEHERAAARAFEHLVVADHTQAALFARLAPESAHKLAVVGNGVDPEHFSPHIVQRNPYGGGRALVIAGAMDDPANAAAAGWFAHAVFRRLRAADPALRLYIVGARPGPRVRGLARIDGVCVTGAVPDLRPWLAHAALVVSPLLSAPARPPVVLEAMALQKPVLATPAALAGFALQNHAGLLVADGAEQFAAQARSVLAGAHGQLGRAARECVLRDHAWQSCLAPLATLLAASAQRRASAS
jgi:sugar transferase (PEP-CTERM/EpsH1 system associated)